MQTAQIWGVLLREAGLATGLAPLRESVDWAGRRTFVHSELVDGTCERNGWGGRLSIYIPYQLRPLPNHWAAHIWATVFLK